MIIRCSHSEVLPISELKERFHPKNRNKHPNEQLERLAEILKYQGARYPAKISKLSNKITSGHGRILAAEIAGWDSYPVDYQDYDSEEQEYADVQADNAIASWAELDIPGIQLDVKELSENFDTEMLGIKDFELPDVTAFEGKTDEDEVPEAAETRCKPGDIWTLGRHRLMCGDSTNSQHVEALMDSEKADMVFTDPPYGINVVHGASVGGSKPFGTDGAKNGTCKRIIKAGEYRPIVGDESGTTAVDAYALCAALDPKVMVFWGANYYASSLPDGKKWIVWDKNTTGNFADCELAWTNLEGRVQKFEHTWSGLIKESEKRDKRVHPTQKPIALAEWCFNELGKGEKAILDLFGGSGSTLIACEKTNRRCFMMEIDPHYCDVILARWEKYTGQKAERIQEGGDYGQTAS